MKQINWRKIVNEYGLTVDEWEDEVLKILSSIVLVRLANKPPGTKFKAGLTGQDGADITITVEIKPYEAPTPLPH
jgi:hypothetical protein